MAYVKQCGTGPHSAASQELLNELSAARLTLLNTDKKAAYDLKLNSHLETKRSKNTRSGASSSSNKLPLIAGGTVAAVVIIGAVVFSLSETDETDDIGTNHTATEVAENSTNETESTDSSRPELPLDSSSTGRGESDEITETTSADPPESTGEKTVVKVDNGPTTAPEKSSKKVDSTPTSRRNATPSKLESRHHLQFQGQSYVELANTAELLDLNGSFTIEMWVQLPDVPGKRFQYLAGDEAWRGMNPKVNVDGTCGWVLRTLDGKLGFTIGQGGKNWYSPAGRLPSFDDWQHIAIVKRGTSVRGFANGATVFLSSSRERKFVAAQTNMFLGVRKFAYGDRSSDVAIRAFRVSSSTRYYGDFTPPKSFGKDADTLVLLDFSKGDGTQLADLSGNGHHGTISGAQWKQESASDAAVAQSNSKPVDLLKLIDLKRDAVAGKFSLENGRLTWQKKRLTRLQIPFDVPGEYDLVITSTRSAGSGLMVGLLAGGHRTVAVVDGSGGSGLDMLDSKSYSKNESFNSEKGLFQPSKESTVICSVRKSSVKITFDGKTLIDWKGDPTRLSMHKSWAVPDKRALFIGGNAGHTISKLELKPPSTVETPKLVRTVDLQTKIDLLKLIDPKRDAVKGNWKIDGPSLVSPNELYARLQLPYKLPEEYILDFNAERLEEISYLCFVLPAGKQQFQVILDRKGQASLLAQLDGLGDTPRNESRYGQAIFTDGKSVPIQIAVRKSRVTITVEGKKIIDWKGSFDRLSLEPAWKVPDSDFAYIGSQACSFRISKLELKLTGPAGLETRPFATLADRKPVPDASTLKKSETLIKDLFKNEYAAAKKPEQKFELAKKLLDQGVGTSDDPVSKYVMLREARDLAADAGMAQTALSAVEEIIRDYEVDPWHAREETLSETAKHARFAPQNKELIDVTVKYIDVAVADNRYALAVKLTNIAVSAARKVRDKNIRSQIAKIRSEVTALKKDFDTAQKAAVILKEKPDDPAANFAWGSYLCLQKNDWSAGLPLLAKSGDTKLKKVIELDLASPTETAAQVKLADAWWDWVESSKKKKGNQKFRIATHYWYTKAVGEVKGLVKLKVEKRLKEIGDVDQPRAETAAYNDRDLAREKKGKNDIPIAELDEAIRLDPKSPVVYFNRGNAWSNKGEYDKAIVDYSESIRLDPKYAWAYSKRGAAWKEKGESEKAKADLNEAARLFKQQKTKK